MSCKLYLQSSSTTWSGHWCVLFFLLRIAGCGPSIAVEGWAVQGRHDYQDGHQVVRTFWKWLNGANSPNLLPLPVLPLLAPWKGLLGRCWPPEQRPHAQVLASLATKNGDSVFFMLQLVCRKCSTMRCILGFSYNFYWPECIWYAHAYVLLLLCICVLHYSVMYNRKAHLFSHKSGRHSARSLGFSIVHWE